MDSSPKQRLDLVVYRGFPVSNSYVWSPFVTKLEARLRFAGVPYRLGQGSMSKAPRGKIPYIEIAHEGQESPIVLGDSTVIIQRLVDDNVCEDLNAMLSPVTRVHDVAIRALLEDKLCFYQMYEKWHDNYETMRSGVLGAIPWPIQPLVGLLAHRGVTRTLYGQGTGRFSGDEITSFRYEIWENINTLLAEARLMSLDSRTPFWILGGSGPSESDATVYGFIASNLVCSAAPNTQKVIRSYPVLIDYASRIHSHFFGEYTSWDDIKQVQA